MKGIISRNKVRRSIHLSIKRIKQIDRDRFRLTVDKTTTKGSLVQMFDSVQFKVDKVNLVGRTRRKLKVKGRRVEKLYRLGGKVFECRIADGLGRGSFVDKE